MMCTGVDCLWMVRVTGKLTEPPDTVRVYLLTRGPQVSLLSVIEQTSRAVIGAAFSRTVHLKLIFLTQGNVPHGGGSSRAHPAAEQGGPTTSDCGERIGEGARPDGGGVGPPGRAAGGFRCPAMFW